MGAAELRIKREECKRTKHDSHFSKWKVLVGPSDWADYLIGKEGADRYRVHNLPATSDPGLYELGITVSRTNKLESDDVVVVYLGQADSVRTRLQRYGRSGAHLNNSNDGSGCFDDIFGRGHSIVYRWALMKNKADALKTESELLNTFDYAWNKGSNGTRRHYDVLQKLNNVAANNIQFPKTIRKLLYFSHKPVGINIQAIKLPTEQNKSSKYDDDDEDHNFLSQIFKFTKSQPKLVFDRHGADKGHTGICGVSLDDSSVCSRPPVEGRKRCAQHKGLRVSRSNPVKNPVVSEKCTISEEHKWRKTNGPNSNLTGTSEYVHDVVLDSDARSSSKSPEIYRPGTVQPQVFSESSTAKHHYDTICGVGLGDGTSCNRKPVKGRVRCEEHKGLKIKGIKPKSAAEDKSNVCDGGSNLSTFDERNHCISVCGAQTLNGSYCRRPVKGDTSCRQHSKQVFNEGSTISSCNDWSSGGNSVCGAPTRNGSLCKRAVKGGGRCWQH